MNGQNNSKLKKAIIICGIFVVFILALYIGSVFINGNVAKKMTGKMLYTARENDTDTVYMYDFTEKENKKIGTGTDAVFYNDGIAYINENEIYIYSDDKSTEFTTLLDGTFKKVTSTEDKLVAVTTRKSSGIITINKDGVQKTVIDGYDNIADVCTDGKNIFFAAVEKNKITVYEIGMNSGTATKLFQEEVTDDVTLSYYDGKIYLTEPEEGKNRAAQYNTKTEKATLLKFSTDEFNVKSFVPVTDSKFLALCDKENDYEIYVCNGSNMVKTDAFEDINITAVTDYTN